MSFAAGSIVSKVTADLAPLGAAFNRARGMARGFAGSMDSTLGAIGRKLTSPVAAIAGTVGAALTVQKAISSVNQSLKDVDAAAKAADRIGITTEAYQGLSLAAELAGTDMETVGMGLRTMQRGLAEASDAAAKANNAFVKLGIDARELANLPAEEAMGRLADELAKIENPTQRVSAAMDVFGAKAGPKLLNLLMQGSSGIKAAREEAERLGITFNRTDAAKVEAANDAWSKAARLVQGLSQTVAIELAPVIEAIANKFTAAGAEASGGFRQRVIGAIGAVAKGIGYLLDGLEGLKAAWHALRVAASTVLFALLKPVDALIQSLDYLYQKLTRRGPSQVAQMSSQFMREIEKDIKSSFEAAGDAALAMTSGKHSQAAMRFLEQARTASDEAARAIEANAKRMRDGLNQVIDPEEMAKAEESIAKLRLEVERFGMTEAAKAMADFAAMPGVTEEQIGRFRSLREELDAMNAARDKANALADAGKRIFEETRTPLEKYEAQIGELHELLSAGAIDWETYGRAVQAARERLESATPKAQIEKPVAAAAAADPRLASFIRAGSAQAIQYAFLAQRQQGPEEVAKRHLHTAEASKTVLEQIRDRLDFETVEV